MTTEILTLLSLFAVRLGVPVLITLIVGMALGRLDERRTIHTK